MNDGIVSYLRSRTGPVPARDVMAWFRLSHEDAYVKLVELEGAGMVRVVVDASRGGPCSGVRGWEPTA